MIQIIFRVQSLFILLAFLVRCGGTGFHPGTLESGAEGWCECKANLGYVVMLYDLNRHHFYKK